MVRISWRIAVGLALALSSTTPVAGAPAQNPIAPSVRDGLYVKDVVIDWLAPENAADPDYASKKAEMIAALKSQISGQFKYSPWGATAVVLHVRLSSFHRYDIVGDVAVLREADQQELGTYGRIEGGYVGQASGGGLLGAVVGLASVPDPTLGSAYCFAMRLRARFNDFSLPNCP